MQYGDAWVAMYCDPEDCTSIDAAKSWASRIISDRDIIELTNKADDRRPTGPYLVEVTGRQN